VIELIRQRSRGPLPERVAEAFRAVPRHLFVPPEHLALAYQDVPVPLVDGAGGPTATISQPSLVLDMLRVLDVQPGQRVLEIGAASGWNAAMLGHLVGPTGQVTSLEILPALAALAAFNVSSLGLPQVQVVHADGAAGWPPGAPYDRVIYTASAMDLPAAVRAQVADGGRVLLVLSIQPDIDCLVAFERHGQEWISHDLRFCRFVPMAGAQATPRQAATLEELLDELGQPELTQTEPFWFGVDSEAQASWSSLGLRLFLGLTEPGYRPLGRGFGLTEGRSLVLARYGELRCYGGLAARQRLDQALVRWVTSGMPAAAAWTVTIGGEGGWPMPRPEDYPGTPLRWHLQGQSQV
jgi:protein-L-isoaspartate(D-aspartate) O-methyltransferase